MTGRVLDRRELNRALLARQMLLRRTELTPLAMIEHLVGMQSQLPMPPYTGLWTRIENFDPAELSAHVLDRTVVRIALMRSTVHLVSAADCLEFRSTLLPVLQRGMTPGSPFGKALTGIDLTELAALGRAAVERTPLTGTEMAAELQQRWPGVDARALAFAVRALVPLVQVPPRGTWNGVGQTRCTSAEVWLGRPPAPPDVPNLLRRYLKAYGPASVRDAGAWSGLTGLGPVFERLRPELSTFRDESGVELFDLPDAPRPAGDVVAPVRLLPDFDAILLSHENRTRMFPKEHQMLIFTTNGIIHSSVLVDGFVRAIWSVASTKKAATVIVRPLPPLAGAPLRESDLAAIKIEAMKFLAFAHPGKSHDVQIGAELTV